MAPVNPPVELPPHARRRAAIAPAVAVMIGITSACAEKSNSDHEDNERRWNYLRMRGEECDLSPWLS